jgi:hypothetical protein
LVVRPPLREAAVVLWLGWGFAVAFGDADDAGDNVGDGDGLAEAEEVMSTVVVTDASPVGFASVTWEATAAPPIRIAAAMQAVAILPLPMFKFLTFRGTGPET